MRLKDEENPETPDPRDQFLTLRICEGNRLSRNGLASEDPCVSTGRGVLQWRLRRMTSTEMRVLRLKFSWHGS